MRGNFSSRCLLWGFLAASICVCRGFSPQQAFSDQEIDWQKVQEIRQKQRQSLALTDEERAYFQRVEQWRQKRIEEFRATHTPGPSSGLVPLTELGNRTYKGVEGGLYPGGKNAPPEPHLQAGLRLAREIVPREGRGQPSQDGRIALLSVGMSNTTQEFQVVQQVAASPSRSAEAARATRQYVQDKQHEILSELIEFLSIPNVSADLPNIQKNALHLKELMQRRGIQTRILEEDVAPLVYGEWKAPGASQTLLFYCHYDGDPVEPAQWVGHRPFEPVLRNRPLEAGGEIIPFPHEKTSYDEEGRIYARSASDDKSPIIALLAALDALSSAKISPTFNLKFLFEGEEEAGSPHLEDFLGKYRELFQADLVVFADGPVYQTGEPTLYFGVRGIAKLEITVYGPLRHLHSGHYGNWAPNPGSLLSRLLVSLKDQDGKVLVGGFYDDVRPLSDEEKLALQEAPRIEEKLREELGLGWTEGFGERLPYLTTRPSLNIHGLHSGWVGDQARTIVPAEATASIDLRLVPDIEPATQLQRVIEHIRRQGFFVVEDVPTRKMRLQQERMARVTRHYGYPALRTPMDLPICRQLVTAVEEAAGKVVRLPTMGGSVPLYLFREQLGVPVVGLPTVNFDNNQHSPNENVRVGHFLRAIEIFAAVFGM